MKGFMIMPQNQENAKKHSVVMNDCRELSVTGVTDVINFDETSVILSTTCGIMSIDGSGLHILNLNVDSGEVTVTGEIGGMIYPQSAKKPSGGLFKKGR